MRTYILFLILAILVLMSISACKYEPTIIDIPQTSLACHKDTIYFENDILPIFVTNCATSGCHNEKTKKAGIKTIDYVSIRKHIRPFDLSKSELLNAISTNKMPPASAGKSPLSNRDKELLIGWIDQGALHNSCNCDTSNISFGSVWRIMARNCTTCHSNFKVYNEVKKKVDSGKLYGTISHADGYPPMPMAGLKLSQCEIRQIKSWIDAGATDKW